MSRNEILRLVLAFAVGVLLTLLVTLRSTPGRYVPFGPGTNRILDTRHGRVYGLTEYKTGREMWVVLVPGVGAK